MVPPLTRALALCRAARPVKPLFALAGAALAHGAGGLVVLLRWRPLAFAYHENALGIVSVATLERYPAQGETVYAALAAAMPLCVVALYLAAWLAFLGRTARDADALRDALARGARVAPAMLLSLGWALAVPWPRIPAAIAWFGGPLALVFSALAAERGAGAAGGASPPASGAAPADDTALAIAAGAGAAVGAFLAVSCTGTSPATTALAGATAVVTLTRGSARAARLAAPLVLLLLYPYVAPLGVGAGALAAAVLAVTALAAARGGLPLSLAGPLVAGALLAAVALDPSTVQRVTCGVPDRACESCSFTWLAEHGQRLEWASRRDAGEIPGRDFLFLYGPAMLDLWRVAFRAFGRTHAAFLLSSNLQDLAGLACVLALALALCRTRLFAAVALLCTVPVYLRSGVTGAGLLLLAGDAPAGWFAAGACLGAGAMYSQEFAVAHAAAALVLLAYRAAAGERAPRAAALWVAGGLAVVAPYALVLAHAGALGPMLASMVTYPRLMLAGFGKLPYPSLLAMLPLSPGEALALPARSNFACTLLAFYALPCAYLIGLAYAAARRLAAAPATRRERLVAALAVYGLVSFRAGLGHSCLGHQEAILWPAVLIAAFVAEAAALALPAPGRLAGAALFAAALTVKPAGLRFDQAWRGFAPGVIRGCTGLLYEWVPCGAGRDAEVPAVIDRIRATTLPDAPLLALPNGCAYHFFTGRPNPTPFAGFSLMITREHRLLAVAACERRPPACVVYDLATTRLDNIPDRLQLSELLAWVAARYEVRERLGNTLLLYPASPATSGTVPFSSPQQLRERLDASAPAFPFRLEWRP